MANSETPFSNFIPSSPESQVQSDYSGYDEDGDDDHEDGDLALETSKLTLSSSSSSEFRGYVRLEVYKIMPEYIHRDRQFLKVKVESYGRNQTIYHRKENQPIPLSTPLPLSGPSRPFLATSPLLIYFGNPKWKWLFYKHFPLPWKFDVPEVKGVITESVYESSTYSSLALTYEWIPNSIEAAFTFSFVLPHTPSIRITRGLLSVSTLHQIHTERILKSFPDSSNFLVPHTHEIPLDRPIVAMPLRAHLLISVHLTYTIRSIEKTISATTVIRVPDRPEISVLTFPDSDGIPSLLVEITWKDELFPFLKDSQVPDKKFYDA